MTTTPRLSAECTMAMKWPDQHNQCTSHGCSCTCHNAPAAFIGHRGTAPAIAPQDPA